MLLSGCNLNFISNEDDLDNDRGTLSEIKMAESDASYLQIAKDLYVAGQYRQAYQIAINLSENNNVEAQYLQGYMLYYGQGVAIDKEQGTKWISVAADTGYRPAIEALVLIKHGLTPDNKCSPVNLIQGSNTINNGQSDKKSNPVSDSLNKGEVLITPKKSR